MSSARQWLAGLALAAALPAAAVEDLRALEVLGQRGQSLEQTRRDRYECHNWAVEQTGESPPAAPIAEQAADDDKRALRRERVGRALMGAAIGGTLGGLFGDQREPNESVLAGAAVGAGIGAATAGPSRRKGEQPEGPSDYLRALTACLEGRGYSVSLPAAAQLTASR
jgi:hypothetical protein